MKLAIQILVENAIEQLQKHAREGTCPYCEELLDKQTKICLNCKKE